MLRHVTCRVNLSTFSTLHGVKKKCTFITKCINRRWKSTERRTLKKVPLVEGGEIRKWRKVIELCHCYQCDKDHLDIIDRQMERSSINSFTSFAKIKAGGEGGSRCKDVYNFHNLKRRLRLEPLVFFSESVQFSSGLNEVQWALERGKEWRSRARFWCSGIFSWFLIKYICLGFKRIDKRQQKEEKNQLQWRLNA